MKASKNSSSCGVCHSVRSDQLHSSVIIRSRNRFALGGHRPATFGPILQVIFDEGCMRRSLNQIVNAVVSQPRWNSASPG